MRTLDLALKDLKQLLRDWKAALFLIAMPIAFTLLFSFIFGGKEQDSRLKIGFLDQDGSPLSSQLLNMLDASDTVRPVELEGATPEQARQQVRDGDLVAALIIPAGYGEQLLSPSDTPLPKPILIVDQNSNAGQAAEGSVQMVVARLLESAQVARLIAQAYRERGGTVDEAFMAETLERAIRSWEKPPLRVIVRRGEGAEQERQSSDGTAHASAGMLVQFAMAGLIGAGEILVLERKSGALRRLLTTPISRLEIIFGHFGAMFVMILVQLAILIAFGQIALKVDYMREPSATLLMVLTTTLWSASMGLLIGVVARTEEQVTVVAMVTMLLLAGLGGAWIPLEFTGPAFQTVGHLTPTAWAMDGFENIIIRGLGIESVLLPATILLAYAVGFFSLAVWKFRFE